MRAVASDVSGHFQFLWLYVIDGTRPAVDVRCGLGEVQRGPEDYSRTARSHRVWVICAGSVIRGCEHARVPSSTSVTVTNHLGSAVLAISAHYMLLFSPKPLIRLELLV